MKEKIEAIKKYLKYFPYDSSANNNLKICEYADEIGIELTGGSNHYINYGYFVINSQIKAGKKYHLTNSTTNYEQNGEDTIVIWSESCGRLAFVSDKYWWDIEDEWSEFMSILKSYNPLDYDKLNNTYIYDLEHGKRLIRDYNDIIDDFQKKVNKKIKEVDLANKKKEIERLQKELEESM
jgi:hypothetical protein